MGTLPHSKSKRRKCCRNFGSQQAGSGVGGEVDRGVRNEGAKPSLEKGEERAGVVLIFLFISHYPNLFNCQ